MKEYLRLVCLAKYYTKMLEAIENTDFSICPNYPQEIYLTNNTIGYWVFQLDVLYNPQDPLQCHLMKVASKYREEDGA